MKKVLTLITALFFTAAAFAGKSGGPGQPVQLDEAALQSEMAGLDAIEQYVLANPGTDLSTLRQERPELLEGLNLSEEAAPMGLANPAEGPLGIPSFLWGCVLGAIGILIVYLITEDSDETKKALWGCVVAVGAYFVFWLVYYLILGVSFF
jgi:hypothetical protein